TLASNGAEAISLCEKKKFDIILADIKMPQGDGYTILRKVKKLHPDTIVIMITAYGSLESAIEAMKEGAFDYISKPFNVPEIMGIIDKSVQRKKLNMKIKEFLRHFFDEPGKGSTEDSDFLVENGIKGLAHLKWNDVGLPDNQNCLEFAKVLASTLEEKDPYTSGHSERVCYYADIISKRLSLYPKERSELQIASYLHDIGKVGISDRFINKKGTLTSTDWAIIKQHTKKSIDLLAPLKLSPNILHCIQYHHEHFDGTGYPDGLAGENIPLGARIIAISDSYDSMTSARPYRKPLADGEAKSELSKWAGKQFDPQLVSVFLEVLKEKEEVFLGRTHFKVPAFAY
ncbi:MAG: HD domain-containing phosphohydrolase, partial [Deltaproteobacteria bacterium]